METSNGRLGRRSWLVLGVTAAAIACGLVAWSRRPAPGVPGDPSEGGALLRPEATTLAPGIHLLGKLSPSAAYVVETTAGLLLVDSGLDRDAVPVKSQMAELGLDPTRIRAILLTHAHGDHCGGAEHLRSLTGAKVYAGKGDTGCLRAGGPRDAFFSTFYMPDQAPHPTTVDVTLEGDETFTFGDVRVRALALPGHTPGSICYLMERGGLSILFSGDVLMRLRGEDHPRTETDKPLGTYSAYLAPRYRGDVEAYLVSLRRLRSMPVPDLVLPGHPGADRTPQSPRLSQARWEALMEAGIRDLETLSARYREDGADFLDGTPKALLPNLYYLGDFGESAVYVLFTSSHVVLVDAPGGPGLAAFVRERLGRLGRNSAVPTDVLLTSCGPESTAGLGELLDEWHPRVVASSAGIPALRAAYDSGTRFLPAEDLPDRGWFAVKTLPLRGRGVAPIAYNLRWGGKTVLFSGRIPIRINQEAGVRLFADFLDARGNISDYIAALGQLRELRPDLWLPAVPTDGQNANLYDDQWEQVLYDNAYGIKSNLEFLRTR